MQVHALIQRNARNILIARGVDPPEPLRPKHLTRPLDQLKKTRKPFQGKFAHPQSNQPASPDEPRDFSPPNAGRKISWHTCRKVCHTFYVNQAMSIDINTVDGRWNFPIETADFGSVIVRTAAGTNSRIAPHS